MRGKGIRDETPDEFLRAFRDSFRHQSDGSFGIPFPRSAIALLAGNDKLVWERNTIVKLRDTQSKPATGKADGAVGLAVARNLNLHASSRLTRAPTVS